MSAPRATFVPQRPELAMRRKASGVIFVIDNSGSMEEMATGDTVTKSKRVEEGFAVATQVFQSSPQFWGNGDIATVLFSDAVTVSDFEPVATWKPPTLNPGGLTHLSKALNVAMDQTESWLMKKNGLEIDCPYIVLLSDGKPCGDSQSMLDLAYERAQSFEGMYAQFLLIGVEESDRQHLAQIGLKAEPIIVSETDWATVFRWVSLRVSGGRPGQKPVMKGGEV